MDRSVQTVPGGGSLCVGATLSASRLTDDDNSDRYSSRAEVVFEQPLLRGRGMEVARRPD